MFEVTRAGQLPRKYRRSEKWFLQDFGLSGSSVADIFLHNLSEGTKSEIVDIVMSYGMVKAHDKVVKLICNQKFGVSASPGMYDKVQQVLPKLWHKWELSSRLNMWESVHRVAKSGGMEYYAPMTGAKFMVRLNLSCLLAA